jgi:peptidyl-tRNA hydrolase
LYIVVRSDLSPGLQASQSVHAAHQFAVDHPDLFARWFRESNTIVIVNAPNETALETLRIRAIERGIPMSSFMDEDLGTAVTALALGPGKEAKRLCQPLKIAFPSHKEVP